QRIYNNLRAAHGAPHHQPIRISPRYVESAGFPERRHAGEGPEHADRWPRVHLRQPGGKVKTPITQVIQIVLERPQSRRLVMWGSAARVPFPVTPWYQHSLAAPRSILIRLRACAATVCP